jgi:hypothetical protein
LFSLLKKIKKLKKFLIIINEINYKNVIIKIKNSKKQKTKNQKIIEKKIENIY